MRELVEQLYRQHAAGIVASLARSLHPSNLDRIEVAVQDAFVKALRRWSEDTVPDNPPAWLYTVARNGVLDVLRRDRGHDDKKSAMAEAAPQSAAPVEGAFYWELPDDQLRMMFVTCHPALSLPSRLALTLHTLCGLRNEDIAAALLVGTDALKKRLVRARKTLREEAIAFELPGPSVLGERVDDVLRVLYLLFSEGYSSHSGPRPIRVELCGEAIRLAGLLSAHPHTRAPRVWALMALMQLQASRIAARVDALGNLITLAEQDRALYDQQLMHQGLQHLAAAAVGDELSDYHLEAGIAACHATASSFEGTDWPRIVGYYEQLAALNASPVIAVNRAIALYFAKGPQAGLEALAAIRNDPRLRNYGPLSAALAEMQAELGDIGRATAAYQHALKQAGSEPERRFLQRKLAELA